MKTRLFKYIENFTTKKWKFSDKNSGEAVLTCTYNLCFDRKYEKYQNFYLKTRVPITRRGESTSTHNSARWKYEYP